MRKLLIALSALAAMGIAMPVMTGAAQAETKKIVIKRGDRGHHYGWRHHHHDYGWRHHRHGTKVVIKHRHRD